jgi:ABC-type phosphate/phosphonate transport system substrate-binding protein
LSIPETTEGRNDDFAAQRVNAPFIASLPMYDFPELEATHDELWAAIRSYLINAAVVETPAQLTRRMAHVGVWTHPFLLLGQGCEYPLAKFFADRVRLVATPRYAVPGCEGSTYRSAILVRDDDSAQTLADLRDRRCAINERASNSGMNMLRASIAQYAGGTRFFESVVLSGSHRRSLQMVAAGDADVAAVDCVSFAHFRQISPSVIAQVRILGWTAAAPSLPFITAAATSNTMLQKLRAALAAVVADRGFDDVRRRLFLDGFDLEPVGNFSEVLQLERTAAALGYPKLH